MCAAIPLPVSRLNVRRQVMTPLVPSFLTVAVNVPRARFTLPFGFGRSFAAESVAPVAPTGET
jgi:hypothetical protein